MKVLLDECVPAQVRNALVGHDVATVSGLLWRGREYGELLDAAEQAGFDVLVIADKNLRHPQNLQGRKIAIVELWTNHRPTPEQHFPSIATAVSGLGPGAYVIVAPP